MSEVEQTTLDRPEGGRPATAADLALERFDAAHEVYAKAMRDVPPAALGYLRPGDDYTPGGIGYHVNAVLRHYRGTAEAMVTARLRGEPAAPDSARPMAEANARAGQAVSESERDSALAETADLHAAVRRAVAGVDAQDWSRVVPVRFGPGDPYPTRLLDVLAWLTDHYGEHIGQLGSLVAEWRTLAAVQAFDRAFAAHDADAVLASMTEDCLFESTSPAPDGERLTGADRVGAFWRQFFASTPSARFRTEEAFAAGDRAVVRWTFDWDEGPENRGHVRGVDVFRVRDGRVAEKLAYVKG
jgi:ketosteroid isomerase-like protein